MERKDSITVDHIKLKNNRIDALNEIIKIRETSLIQSNTKIMEQEKLIKRQKLKILAYKIALIGSAMAYLVLLI